MENIFYVYEHWRPDRDECFYVGKGKGGRANHLLYRNAHHRAIQAKLARLGTAVEVRIIADGLFEAQAFALEIERIAMWRADGADLTNLTVGGDGVSGLVHSRESLDKMSAAKRGRPMPEGVVEKAAERNRGKKRPAEVVAKIAARNRGSKRTPEQNAKHSERMKIKMRDPEVRRRLSEANKGKTLSAEGLAKLVAANKGRPLTDEHKAKIGAANKGRQTALGMKRSAETLENMSIAATAREARKRMKTDNE